MLHYTFCNTIKPEVIFWPFAMIIYYYAITDFWVYVIILSSIILFANFTVSVLIGLVIIPLWIISLIETNTYPGGIYLVLLIPGIFKNIINVFKLIKSDFAKSINTLQSKKKINKYVFLKNTLDLKLNLFFHY